jgi:hypothetical protein
MRIVILYENEDYKATIPFQTLVDLFELTDEQINSVKQLVQETIRTT